MSNYRRVASSENNGGGFASMESTGPPPPAVAADSAFPVMQNGIITTTNVSLSERLMDKIIALVWVVVAGMTFYGSNSASVLFGVESEEEDGSTNNNNNDEGEGLQRVPNRPLLYAVAVLLGVNTVLLVYLTIYLPRFKGLTDSSAWEVYCPSVIPCMTGCGVLAFLFAIRATWPVWGFLAPLVLGAECMGALFALHFVPWFW